MFPFVSSFNILVTVIAHSHQPLPIHSKTDSLEQLTHPGHTVVSAAA